MGNSVLGRVKGFIYLYYVKKDGEDEYGEVLLQKSNISSIEPTPDLNLAITMNNRTTYETFRPFKELKTKLGRK